MVEKDWYVVRALRVLFELRYDEIRPVFCGGTSLSLGWGLIKRFSEDIDFKIIVPAVSTNAAARAQRRAYREAVLSAMAAHDFQIIGDAKVRDSSAFFSADFNYPSQFSAGQGLRPHLRLEMSFQTPALEPVARSIRSLISRTQKQDPEVAEFFCVDPVETAADKLSALAWRVCVRERGGDHDEPTIIRHLHDLAALEQLVMAAPSFHDLVHRAVLNDSGRGGENAPKDPAERFAKMSDALASDELWAQEYDEFVQNVSFAAADEVIPFVDALRAVRRLIDKVMN
ncbi:nucleotidyl transferase AbiEii/AbiGii toxin family protein [Steroidobacter sp.]|uniref:nucleotidyl transferase AbiEii/AbiGii toxin family protein n=1 Tax=Steroidobacter sp. TaxID=1978227 RepID=UPI001A3781F2|nr:nucleotidyl transferase AbiEii/AbiGii toxin family protein [Steroidobacter sp.]MBL8266166.1 nucleotidyl transferase AbiEii/AbiGii toxin family protein [Steroidobacter sp.]